jgi:RNA polymerase sigma-70 factor (ECF subfamily)
MIRCRSRLESYPTNTLAVHYPIERLNWGDQEGNATSNRPAILDSKELFDRIRRGEESAFDALFKDWYPSLVRASESIVQSRAVAEEIVQDVLLELWRRRESLVSSSSPQAYLFQSTRNRSLNHVRHERVVKLGEPYARRPESTESMAHGQMVEDEMQAAVRQAVAALPDRCREVFELSRVHGLKYTEIAETLEISVKTVEAQMGKALRILREVLSPWIR